jgi:uncharacterized protein (TIGR03067 family)
MLSRPGLDLILGLGLGMVLCLNERSWADKSKIEGDLRTIQGEWVSKDEQGESIWSFEGDHVSLKTPTRAYEMTIKLDPNAEPEKHIDFNVLEDSPNAKGHKAPGIYKLSADGTLKICFADGDAGRPREFKTDFGKSFSFNLKKKKK